MHFQQDGHHCFGEFAAQRLAVVEKVTAYQLLGQRGRTLIKAAAPEVYPDGPQDTNRINADMGIKSPVLDNLQCCR